MSSACFVLFAPTPSPCGPRCPVPPACPGERLGPPSLATLPHSEPACSSQDFAHLVHVALMELRDPTDHEGPQAPWAAGL